MRLEAVVRCVEGIGRDFAPVQQVIADGMHDSLLGLAVLAEMGVVAGGGDGGGPPPAWPRPGAGEMHEIVRADLVPRCPLAILRRVTPVLQVEQPVPAILVE